MLPEQPGLNETPFAWWSAVRRLLGYQDLLNLSLSKVYRLLFPEDYELYTRAHTAGADVLMTIRMIECYFKNIRGQPQRGKIDNYFKRVSTEEEEECGLEGGNEQYSNFEGEEESNFGGKEESDFEGEEESDCEGEMDGDLNDWESNFIPVMASESGSESEQHLHVLQKFVIQVQASTRRTRSLQ